MALTTDQDLVLYSHFESSDEDLVRTLSFGTEQYRSSVGASLLTGDDLGDWWTAYLRGARPRSLDPPRSELRSADLFCGAGGLALGLSQAGAELGHDVRSMAAIDHDPEAVGVFTANHQPEVTSTDSVSVLVDYRVKGFGANARLRYEPELLDPRWAQLAGQIDVLLAGPPCQGHSNLNNHSRRDDLRNGLYLSVPAAAIALEAPVVVIENVPAVIHDRTGVVETTMTILEDAGYQIESGVLKADAMGWPQRRGRFFLVARRGQAPLPLSAVASMLADDPRPLSWAIQDVAELGDDDHMARRPDLSEENRTRIDWLFDNEAYDLPLAERPECHQEGTSYTSVYGRLKADQPAPTITTGFMTPGRGRYIHPTNRRVLRPIEAARLQGFPDSYDFRDPAGGPPSTLKLAKWIGDAVPMPLGYAAALSALGAGPIR